MKIMDLLFFNEKDKYNLSIVGVINVYFDKDKQDINLNIYKRTKVIDDICLKLYDINGNHFNVSSKSNDEIRRTIKTYINSYIGDYFAGYHYCESDLDIIDSIDFQKVIK